MISREKFNSLLNPKNSTQKHLSINKNPPKLTEKINHNLSTQKFNIDDNKSRVKIHNSNQRLPNYSTEINLNNFHPNLNKCLVEYEKQNQKLSIKNLIAGKVAKERQTMLEELEKREFREDFFKRHFMLDAPSNIESISIDTKEKIQRESTRLMNNIKQINTKIYTENEDILCYCNPINREK